MINNNDYNSEKMQDYFKHFFFENQNQFFFCPKSQLRVGDVFLDKDFYLDLSKEIVGVLDSCYKFKGDIYLIEGRNLIERGLEDNNENRKKLSPSLLNCYSPTVAYSSEDPREGNPRQMLIDGSYDIDYYRQLIKVYYYAIQRIFSSGYDSFFNRQKEFAIKNKMDIYDMFFKCTVKGIDFEIQKALINIKMVMNGTLSYKIFTPLKGINNVDESIDKIDKINKMNEDDEISSSFDSSSSSHSSDSSADSSSDIISTEKSKVAKEFSDEDEEDTRYTIKGEFNKFRW